MEDKEKVVKEAPTEEQLKYWLDKAINDNKQLMAKLREVTNALNIMPYLFKIVELNDKFPSETVQASIDAIKSLLFPEPITEEIEE